MHAVGINTCKIIFMRSREGSAKPASLLRYWPRSDPLAGIAGTPAPSTRMRTCGWTKTRKRTRSPTQPRTSARATTGRSWRARKVGLKSSIACPQIKDDLNLFLNSCNHGSSESWIHKDVAFNLAFAAEIYIFLNVLKSRRVYWRF